MKKPIIIVTGIIIFLALIAAVGLELTCGLSLSRGLQGLAVGEIYVMADKHQIFFSIDLNPPAGRLKTIRVASSEIIFDINPDLPTDMILSSADDYIWGYRWPWVEKVTITLKTQRQKEGFDKLFAADKLRQLHDDLVKGATLGVTHFGFLTSGGRIIE